MFSKLCRIGNEPVIRHTANGDAVLGLSLAYNYGRKGDDGKRPTQWVDASLWGKQAEAVAPFLKKGDQISVNLDDFHIETYQQNGETKSKLAGKIASFDFVSAPKTESQPAPKPAPKPVTQQPVTADYADIDSDIPF